MIRRVETSHRTKETGPWTTTEQNMAKREKISTDKSMVRRAKKPTERKEHKTSMATKATAKKSTETRVKSPNNIDLSNLLLL